MKTAGTDKSKFYGEIFAAGQATEPTWQRYAAQRQQALASVLADGLGTRGREDWVFGDAGSLVSGDVAPVHGPGRQVADLAVEALADSHLLVFVNGVYEPALSRPGQLPAGVVLQPLSATDELSFLGAAAPSVGDGFAALNALFWRDGLYLDLPDGTVLEHPVELQFRTELADQGGMVAVRNVIRLGAGSQATVVERFTTAAATDVEQPVTEFVCGVGAEANHVKIVGGAAAGEHFGSTRVRQEQDSRYRSWEVLTGGRLVRRELHVDLAAPGAECDLNALYMGRHQQRFDMRTRIDHNAAGCQTRELYKGVLDGAARGVFDGLIRVAADSQQTLAHQTNRNLLLSEEAVVNSIPRLEIYADDVKCSHGSTTGQLDDEQLFYLQTRGFSTAEARAYLAGAFAGEVLESLPVPALRTEWLEFVSRNLEGTLGNSQQEQV